MSQPAQKKLQYAKIETLDFIANEMRARSPSTPFAVEVGGVRYSGDAEFGVADDGVFVIRYMSERDIAAMLKDREEQRLAALDPEERKLEVTDQPKKGKKRAA